MGDGKYDISLIPDIYDCVKYDYLHNRWAAILYSLNFRLSVREFQIKILDISWNISVYLLFCMFGPRKHSMKFEIGMIIWVDFLPTQK